MIFYPETFDMESFDWEQNGQLAHLRSFIREGEIRNTGLTTPFCKFVLRHPAGKHKEYKIRHLGLHVQFNATVNGFIRVGQEAYFGDGVEINASGSSIVIGERVKMSPNSSIYASYHDTYDKEKTVEAPITIGNDVLICKNAVVLKGVEIADNCTIGANAVVTKSFLEPYSVIGGNPGKVLYNAKERTV